MVCKQADGDADISAVILKVDMVHTICMAKKHEMATPDLDGKNSVFFLKPRKSAY